MWGEGSSSCASEGGLLTWAWVWAWVEPSLEEKYSKYGWAQDLRGPCTPGLKEGLRAY